jgi:hypothetical protein
MVITHSTYSPDMPIPQIESINHNDQEEGVQNATSKVDQPLASDNGTKPESDEGIMDYWFFIAGFSFILIILILAIFIYIILSRMNIRSVNWEDDMIDDIDNEWLDEETIPEEGYVSGGHL